mgnify:CR=1 FL=1
MKTLIALLMTILMSSAAVAAPKPPVIYYLGTNQYPVSNIASTGHAGFEIKEFNMDGHLNLEETLSEGLPQDNIELAEKIANERLEKLDWSILQTAFQGLALAASWDIRKLPAFVFAEGQFVIYGVTDAEEAIQRWNQYRGRDHYKATRYK